MDCEQARSLLSQWVDGELSQAESRQLELHLQGCASCTREREQLEGLGRTVRATFSPPPVSEQEWHSLMLRAMSLQARRMGWVLVVPATLALIAAALIALFTDPAIRLWVRVALGAIVGGFVFLLFSVAADRWQAARVERYGQVDR